MTEQTIKLGVFNTLKIARISEPGFYLQDKEENEVLLPNRYIKDGMTIDDEIIVFIYTDSEDRLVATTDIPKGCKDQFIFAEVVDTTKIGAFLDWGLPKDLFVPKNRQKTPFQVGDKRIVRIIEDEKTNRLIAVEKITSYLNNQTKHYKRNDKVSLLIFAKTPMGFKSIVDNSHEGMIYHNEIFQKIHIGQSLEGYIKYVRDDGKLDISLQAIGKEKNTQEGTNKVVVALKEHGGVLPYNYKTDPETIKELFQMSKKNYKKTLTALIESKTISVDDDGMKLL